jgi:CubicO group peptidase (beta-lactamase class C family)
MSQHKPSSHASRAKQKPPRIWKVLTVGAVFVTSIGAPRDILCSQRREATRNVSTSFELRAGVDACVQSAMSANDIPGLAVGVVADGEIAYERGYGVKHRDRGGDVDEHTLFRPGSVDKMFTAAAILRLVDQGCVDLDDPVTEIVPELHFAPGRWNADQMLVRHLIANTAAIPSFRSLPDGSLSDWVLTLDAIPLLAKPGAFFNYSNSNFALADMVVERASGMAFSDYMAAEIYRPAGMRDSTRNAPEARASGNSSFGHADDGTIYAPDDYAHIFDGFMSAHDIARWAQIMLNDGEDVLSRKSAFMAQAPQVPLLFYPAHLSSIGGGSYGFGLFVEDYPDGRVVRHSGGIPGWVSQVAWVPSQGFAVVMLANSWPNAFDGLEDAVECILESSIGFTMPDVSEPSHPSTWSRYAGTYDAVFEDGFEFEVIVEYQDGELLMTAPDPNHPSQMITRVLENVHASGFLFRPNENDWWDITFVRNKGKPAPVRWLRNQRFVGLRQTGVRRTSSRSNP